MILMHESMWDVNTVFAASFVSASLGHKDISEWAHRLQMFPEEKQSFLLLLTLLHRCLTPEL